MVLSVVKYAVVGYAVVKGGQFVVRKVRQWRGSDVTTQQ